MTTPDGVDLDAWYKAAEDAGEDSYDQTGDRLGATVTERMVLIRLFASPPQTKQDNQVTLVSTL